MSGGLDTTDAVGGPGPKSRVAGELGPAFTLVTLEDCPTESHGGMRHVRSSSRQLRLRDELAFLGRLLRRGALLSMVFGDEHIERGDDEQREQRADRHASDENDTDRVSRDGAGAGDE